MGRNDDGDTMRLYTGGKDISDLILDLSWSGDTKECARKVSFNCHQNPMDKQLPKISLEPGNDIILKDDAGKTLYGGVIFDVELRSASRTLSVLSYDLLYYVNKSDVSKTYDDLPENIARSICNELNIPCGDMAKTNIKVYVPCLSVPAYKAIMMAYSEASKVNQGVYMPIMKDVNKLSVIEKGDFCGVVVDGDYNLIDSSFKVSSQEVVNRVSIADKDGNIKKTLDDYDSRNKYGTIQKVYKEEEGKDAEAQAKALFHGISQSASVSVKGDLRAVSGTSLAVQEKSTGLYGLFFIESDTHTFANGKHEMSLTLEFKNMMDVQEVQT